MTDLLADTLGRERIRLGCPVTGFVEESDQVAVRLADGSTEAGDLLLGADGVHSTVRAQLVPGAAAQEHAGHVAWRAVLPAAPEGIEGDVLVIGHQRCRGGYLKSPEGGAFWLLAQFQSPPVTGKHREECLRRAANLDDGGWNSILTKLISATPEDRILFNQILIVPELDKWVSGRVALVGDAAHGMSPHITAGASLGVQDPLALVACLDAQTDLSAALAAYEAERIPHYRRARQLSEAVEAYRTPSEFAHAYAAFSHWMIGH